MEKPHPNVTDDQALELFGAMIGDGCLSKYFANYQKRYLHVTLITGNAIKEKEYHLYLCGLMKKLFGVSVNPRIRKNSNTLRSETCAKHVFDWFIEQGFPCGMKNEISIPEKIMDMPKEKLNLIVRGIFDTDGQISARKDEKYRYPYIFISSSSSTLRQQLKDILRSQDIPAYISRDNVVVRGLRNFKKWSLLIGSSNQRNL